MVIKVYPSAGSTLLPDEVIISGRLALCDAVFVPLAEVGTSESVIILVGTHQFGLLVE